MRQYIYEKWSPSKLLYQGTIWASSEEDAISKLEMMHIGNYIFRVALPDQLETK